MEIKEVIAWKLPIEWDVIVFKLYMSVIAIVAITWCLVINSTHNV